MDIKSLAIHLTLGAVSGWLAARIMRGGGFGLAGNIVVGMVGAAVGGYVFSQFGISVGSGLAGSVITATAGAMILLFLIRLIKSA
jgi:uncharacterized membrane protein YeaQ/YmgE (transglycosylase-associated protein family)